MEVAPGTAEGDPVVLILVAEDPFLLSLPPEDPFTPPEDPFTPSTYIRCTINY